MLLEVDFKNDGERFVDYWHFDEISETRYHCADNKIFNRISLIEHCINTNSPGTNICLSY